MTMAVSRLRARCPMMLLRCGTGGLSAADAGASRLVPVVESASVTIGTVPCPGLRQQARCQREPERSDDVRVEGLRCLHRTGSGPGIGRDGVIPSGATRHGPEVSTR